MAVQDAHPHPVREALASALKDRWEQFMELLGGLPSQSEWGVLRKVLDALATNTAVADDELKTAVRAREWLSTLGPLHREILELESWSGPPLSPAERNSKADQFARLLLSDGLEFREAAESAALARKRRSGAPVKRRFIAAQALELKKLKPTRFLDEDCHPVLQLWQLKAHG